MTLVAVMLTCGAIVGFLLGFFERDMRDAFVRGRQKRRLLQALREVKRLSDSRPIEMLLDCPFCHASHASHVDVGDYRTRPHKTHLCENCRMEWQPANVPTVGVLTLPK